MRWKLLRAILGAGFKPSISLDAPSAPAEPKRAPERLGYTSSADDFLHYGSASQEDLWLRVWKAHSLIRYAVAKQARLGSEIDFEIQRDPHYRGEVKEADRQLIEDFFLYPNPLEDDMSSIMYQTLARLKITGRAAWEVVWSGGEDSRPYDFYYLPGTVKPLVDEHGSFRDPAAAYEQRLGHQAVTLGFKEVIYFRIPDITKGGLHGASDLQAMDLDVNTDLFTSLWWKKFYKNSASKRFAYILQKGLSPEEIERTAERIKSEHQSVARGHQPAMVVENETRLESLDFSPKELGFLDEKEFLSKQILMTAGAPGERELDQFFLEEVQPLLKIIEHRINWYLKAVWRIYGWQFRFRQFIPSDLRGVARIVQILQRQGAITINEARSFVGLAPKEGGDRLFLVAPTGLVEVTETGAQKAGALNVAPAPKEACLEADILHKPEMRKAIPRLLSRMQSASRPIERALRDRLAELCKENALTAASVLRILEDNVTEKSFLEPIYTSMVDAWLDGDQAAAKTLKLARKEIRQLTAAQKRSLAAQISSDLANRLKFGDSLGRGRIDALVDRLLTEKANLEQISEQVLLAFRQNLENESRRIANSEIPRAYAEGQLNAVKESGRGRVRIELGPKACEWCITHAPFVETVADAEKYFADHHPNVECSLVVEEEGK